MSRSESTFGPVRETFRAIAMTVVPEAAALADEEWTEVHSIIEQGVSSRPPAIRRQLRLLVRMLNILPVFRFGRTFRGLDPLRRARFLESVQDAPILLLRRGFWGIRTLVFMGYYSRTSARAEIGYRASVNGWEARS